MCMGSGLKACFTTMFHLVPLSKLLHSSFPTVPALTCAHTIVTRSESQ